MTTNSTKTIEQPSASEVDSTAMFCAKCASEDIRIQHVPKGKTVNTSAWNRVETDFLTSSEFDIYFRIDAKREHLSCRCRQCDYGWRQSPAQNKYSAHSEHVTNR